MTICDDRDKIYEFMKRHLERNSSWTGKAAKYAVLNKGHLWRPMLLLRVAKAYEVSTKIAVPIAAGVEYSHVSSLILDDLRSMDDSPYRRNKPSTHRVFGEAITILASHYLLAQFESLIADSKIDNSQKVKIFNEKAHCLKTLIHGQEIDLLEQRKIPCPDKGYNDVNVEFKKIRKPSHFLADPTKIDSLEEMLSYYEQKTGVLFGTSAVIGGIIGKSSDSDLSNLRMFGLSLGLAYQLGDDLMDHTGKGNYGGKPIGQDVRKQTPVTLLGVERTRGLKNYFENFAGKILLRIRTDVSCLEYFLEEMHLATP